MALELFSDVILTRDVPERGLSAGDVGTVVERHEVADIREEGYSVEFFDMMGNTVAVVTDPRQFAASADADGSPCSSSALLRRGACDNRA